MGLNFPRQGPMTRARAGALKRAHPELDPVQEIELGSPTKRSPKKKKTAAPDPMVGSPWDATVRTKLNVDDLDLNTSYVGTLTRAPPQEDPRPPRQPRWRHEGDQPLIDIKRLPEGWNTREPDLDPEYVPFPYSWGQLMLLTPGSDIEAQIQRAKERIEDNIMPHTFETRLKEYESRKAEME